MATFAKIMNAKEFDTHTRHVPFGTRILVARYWHDDRYLSGSVNCHTRIGKFIRMNEASDRDEVIKIDHYGYELFIEPRLTLSWRFIREGRDPPDFTLALAADPNPIAGPDERLFYGKVIIDGLSYYGQVRADGKCYVAKYFSFMQTDVVLTFNNFHILEYAKQMPKTTLFAPLNLQHARGNMAPYFHPIRKAEDFDFLVPEAYRSQNCVLVARLWHVDRYLPGFVSANTRIGVFIRRDEAQKKQTTIYYDREYDLLVNWADTLEWKKHDDEGDHVDLTNAFPANAEAPERLYYGRCDDGDGYICYGLVYEDGNCYAHFADEMLIWCSCFEVLEYKQPRQSVTHLDIIFDGIETYV